MTLTSVFLGRTMDMNNASLQQSTSASLVKSWMVCLTASLFFFYEFIQMHMFSSITPQLMREFHLNAVQLGMLSSSYLFADVLVLLPAGVILDRVSTRSVILTAMLICIVGTGGFALSQNYMQAAFFHFLSGIGNGFCFLSCIMLATRWFPAEKRAFVVGVIVTSAMLGGVVAQKPFALLSGMVGWRQTCLYDLALGIVIFSLIWLQVTDAPDPAIVAEERSKLKESTSFVPSLISALTNKQNWFCGLYTSLLNLPIMLLDALWGGIYLTQIHNISMEKATMVTSMIFFGMIVGSPSVGWLSDYIGKRRQPMIIGAILSLVTMLVIMQSQNLSYINLLILFFCLGLFTSAQVIAYPMVAESNPANMTGTSMGLASLLIMGGGAVAQPLFGYLIDKNWGGTIVDGVRIYSASDFQTALNIIPIGFVIGLIAVLLSKETRCKSIVVE